MHAEYGIFVYTIWPLFGAAPRRATAAQGRNFIHTILNAGNGFACEMHIQLPTAYERYDCTDDLFNFRAFWSSIRSQFRNTEIWMDSTTATT